jgi:hypothetical protein
MGVSIIGKPLTRKYCFPEPDLSFHLARVRLNYVFANTGAVLLII